MKKEDINIRNWYNKVIFNRTEEPPGDVWDNIENQLDVDDVWYKIDNQLNSNEKIYNTRRAFYYAAAAIALFFMARFFGGQQFVNNTQYYSDNVNEINSKKSNDKSSIAAREIKQDQNNGAEIIIPVSKNNESNAKSNEHALMAIKSKNKKENNSKFNKTGQLQEHDLLKELSAYKCESIANNTGNNYRTQLAYHDKAVSYNYHEKNIKPRKFYIGVTGQVKNTWLFNSTTIRGLRKDELNKTVPDFDKDIALHAGLQLTEKIDIAAVANFRTFHNQKYYDYVHGNYIAKETVLNYTMLDVQFKYDLKGIKSMSIASTNLIFGCYGGLLKKAKEKTGNDTEKVTYDYRNYDIGFTLGYEYEIDLWNNVRLTPGIRLNQGIFNIFKGDEYVPAYFNRTYSTAFNFNIGVNYYIN